MSISGINNNYGQSYYNTAKEGQSGKARQVVKNNKTEETSVSD